MAYELIGSVTFIDANGDLVRQDDYFDEATGMPYFNTTVLRRNARPVVGREEELGREIVRSWTGADLEVRTWRDRYGQIHRDEKVVRLNTGDDDDCPSDGRFGR